VDRTSFRQVREAGFRESHGIQPADQRPDLQGQHAAAFAQETTIVVFLVLENPARPIRQDGIEKPVGVVALIQISRIDRFPVFVETGRSGELFNPQNVTVGDQDIGELTTSDLNTGTARA